LPSDDNHDASSEDNDYNHDASSEDNDVNDDINDDVNDVDNDGNAPYDVNHNVNNDGNAPYDVNHAGSRLRNASRPPRTRPAGCGQLSRTRLRHDHHGRDDVGDLIAVTAAEIRRLLTAFTHPQHPGEHHQHWSRWRRHHQAQARQPHDQRRLTSQPLPMRC
jgi:hypothetical protein